MGKPEKVYVIATQLDTLNQPKEDWARQQVEWTKYLEEEQCYKTPELVQNNLVPVSAYLYTRLQDYRDNRLDGAGIKKLKALAILRLDLDLDTDFKDLEDFTNIKFLYSKLQTEIVSKYKTDLIDDIVKSYERCQKAIKKDLRKQKQAQEKVISDSQLGVEEIRQERDKKLAELKAVQDDKRELTEFVRQLKAATEQRVEEVVKAIKS